MAALFVLGWDVGDDTGEEEVEGEDDVAGEGVTAKFGLWQENKYLNMHRKKPIVLGSNCGE